MNRSFQLIFVAALVAGCGPGRIIEPLDTSGSSGSSGGSVRVDGASSSSATGSTSGDATSNTSASSSTTGARGTTASSTAGATTASSTAGATTASESASTGTTGESTDSGSTASASTTGTTGHHTQGSTASSSTTSSGGGGTTSGGTTTGGTTTGGTGSATVATLGGCAMFPPDSVWNTDISQAPVSSHSSAWVSAIGSGTGVHPDFGTVWDGAPNGIPFVVVPISQPLVGVNFVEYPSESDPGPYPTPLDAPIEGGPNSSGDRHVLVLQQVSCTLYELYHADPGSNAWSAGSGAIWHLSENEQRRDGETSADAAGLPMLPGLVRYDEVQSGEIRHALRFTAASIQSAYIYPATHSDGTAGSNANHPPMGARFRLKASFDVSGFPPEVQVILNALKQYGMILADTGGDWFVSGAPDPRWDDGNLATLSRVKGSDFEAIENGPVHAY